MLFLKAVSEVINTSGSAMPNRGCKLNFHNKQAKKKTHGHQTEQYSQLQKRMWSVMAD
jgi:hypothetical protein